MSCFGVGIDFRKECSFLLQAFARSVVILDQMEQASTLPTFLPNADTVIRHSCLTTLAELKTDDLLATSSLASGLLLTADKGQYLSMFTHDFSVSRRLMLPFLVQMEGAQHEGYLMADSGNIPYLAGLIRGILCEVISLPLQIRDQVLIWGYQWRVRGMVEMGRRSNSQS
jgi:hypothetical protein